MSSVMERLCFLDLYRFRSDDFPLEYNYSHPVTRDTVGTNQQYNRSRSEPVARKPASKTVNEAEKAARAKVVTKKAITTEVRTFHIFVLAPWFQFPQSKVKAFTEMVLAKANLASLKRVQSRDLWVLTGDDDVIDPVPLEKENVRHFHNFIDSVSLIVPDNLLLVYYDYLHLMEICIFNFNIDV
ncbi:hypothetical protein ZWY2020_045154 [Hordeum vulgare]|nr:hypothetical protein ZWY2020_045154 [Hordeum vulgare]